MKGNRSERKKSENVRFFDRWAGSYDQPLFQFWMRRFYRPALKLINRDISKDIDGWKVLDVSVGTGKFLQELANRKRTQLTTQLYGTDLSPQMIAEAHKNLGHKAELKIADVHTLPFPDNTFDYVVSTESFHHYYDQSQALAEMKRVSKKGGKVIVVDINFFLRPIHWIFEKLEPGCVRVNGWKEMRALFQKTGLRQVIQQRSFIFSVLTAGVKS